MAQKIDNDLKPKIFEKVKPQSISRNLFNRIFELMPLLFIIAIAILIRLFAALQSEGFIHPDEIFQSIEMVHYRIFGKYGRGQTIPWEYDLDELYGGARSWFFVFCLTAVYRFVMLFGVSDPLVLIFFARLTLALFSIITVLVAYFFGKELFSNRVGLIAALLCSTWWFFPFWASRTMTDAPASDLLFLSMFLAYKSYKTKRTSKKKFLFGLFSGIFLGFAFMLRFPSGLMALPIVGCLIVVSINEFKEIREKHPTLYPREAFWPVYQGVFGFTFGGLGMLLVQGFLDLFTWGTFLHSPVNFFMYNIVEGYSAHHGTRPWFYYFNAFFYEFALYALPVLLFFVIFGIEYRNKRSWETGVLLGIIFYWIILFSVIDHKEFRFLFAIIPLIFLLIANGVNKLVQLIKKKAVQNVTLGLILIGLVSTSAYLAFIPYEFMWKFNSGVCEAMYFVGNQEDVETVLVFENVWYTGGYTYLDKNVTCHFMRIFPFLPQYSFNSSTARAAYHKNGTYVIVDSNKEILVSPIMQEFNYSIIGVFGYPDYLIYTRL